MQYQNKGFVFYNLKALHFKNELHQRLLKSVRVTFTLWQGGIYARDQWGDNYSNLQWGEINIPAWDGK